MKYAERAVIWFWAVVLRSRFYQDVRKANAR